ncbi:ankyrin, partial [Anaeromyces robustus]
INKGNKEGWNSIQVAYNGNYCDNVELLLEDGAKTKTKNSEEHEKYRLLHSAMRHNNREMMNLLLTKSKINMNAKDHQGRTVLHVVASTDSSIKNIELVQSLIHKGAELNLVDNNEDIPVHLACQYGNHKIGQLLLRIRSRDKIEN